ncbi:MAG: PIN domain-containing protein [Candidatus Beckwithbacteria bacterium]
MKKVRKIFLDSDVIISALISKKGAASWLINETKVKKIISNTVLVEVTSRLNELIKKNKIKIIKINKSDVKESEQYVNDKNDAHVLAGAVKAEVTFLLSYNLKDYKLETIKRNLDIIIYRPAQYLQFFRSL